MSDFVYQGKKEAALRSLQSAVDNLNNLQKTIVDNFQGNLELVYVDNVLKGKITFTDGSVKETTHE